MTTLAELLNSVGDVLTGGRKELGPSPQPAWQQAITKPVIGFADKIVRGVAQEADPKALVQAFARVNPITAPMAVVSDYQQGGIKQVVDNARAVAGQVAQIPTDIAAAVPGLWVLAGLGTKKAFDYDLRGAQGAAEAVNSIKKFGEENIGEPIAGRKLSDSLLQGNPVDMAGSWTRLVGGAAVNVPMSLPKIATGVDIVNKIGNTAIKTAEVITPVTIAKKPSPGLIGANVGVGATLGVGLEGVFGSSNDPEQVKAKMDSFSKGAQDSAAEGIKEIKAVQAGGTGGTDWENAVAFGLLGTALLTRYKNDVAYRAFTGLTKNETTQVPLGTILKEQFADRNAPIVEMARSYLKRSGNKDAQAIGDSFETKIAERTGASIDTKLQYSYETGQLPDSNIKLTPLNDFFSRVKALGPDAEAAVAKINARHEIDSRQRMLNSGEYVKGAHVGQVGTPAADSLFTNITRMRPDYDGKIRYHMYDTPTNELFRTVNAKHANPNVDSVVGEYFDMMRKLPMYLYEQRLISKQEMVNLGRQNPHYAATELAEGRSHLNRISLKPNAGDLVPGNMFEELHKYFETVVRVAEGNKVKRTAIQPLLYAADYANDPVAKRIFGRRDMDLSGVTAKSRDNFVHYRDANGVARNVEVLDPVYRRALQNVDRPAALTLMQGNMKFLSKPARWFENAAVGPIAAATGSVFAPISAMYSMTIGTAMRDKRYGAAGWLDKAVQELTGGKIGVRGDVLTLAPDAAFRAAQGLAAVFAQRGSRVLKDSVIQGGYLSKVLGPQTAQIVADALATHFKKSWVAELQQRGQLGPSSLMSIDPAKRFKDIEQMMKGQGVFGQAGGLLGDILHAISSAPAASLYAMNKNNPAWKTNKMVREFSGDPSRSGAFSSSVGKGAGVLTTATPWGNIFIQANLRLAKAFKENPHGTAMGIFNAVALPSILATAYNAATGPEYSDYQYNVRSPDRQAGYIYIGIPGRPPEQGLEIPIDPLLRPFKHMSELLAGSTLGLLDGSAFKPGNEGFIDSIRQFVGVKQGLPMSPEAIDQRQRGWGEGSVRSSILHQTIIPPLPPLATAAAAGMGIKLRSYTESNPIPQPRDRGFTEAEGRNPHRSLFGMYEYPQTEEIVSAIGADAGRAIYNWLMDSSQLANEGKAGDILKRSGQKISQRVGDSTKYASGPLFESFQTIAPSVEAAGQAVKKKIDAVEKLTKAYQEFTDKGVPVGNMVGSQKRGYQEGVAGGGPVAPQDMQVLQMAEMISKNYSKLSQEFLGANQDLYTFRSQVQSSTQYSPQMKRALTNAYAEQIIQNNRQFLQQLEHAERILSNRFGRVIRLDQGIDLNRGMDQFKPINSP